MLTIIKRTNVDVACVVSAAAVLALFIWFRSLENRPVSGLTRAYTAALASGQTHLLVSPDPRLLAAADPFDPSVNRSLRILDASLYHGRYYLFFGITPFLTLLVPWALMFGRQITDSWAILAYAFGAVVCTALLLRDLAARYFPGTGPIIRGIALVAGTVCGGGLLLVRNPSIHELEVAAAWFHECLMLLAASMAVHESRHRRAWLAVAGLSVGLAVGARPSQVFAALAAAIFILVVARADSGSRARRAITAGCGLAPLAAVAFGVAWLNWHRFGNPFEFGYRYALVDVRNFAAAYASVRNVPYNIWYFMVGVPRVSGWFPFFETPGFAPIPIPRGYYTLDQVYGVLVTAPFALCSVVLAFGWNNRPPALRRIVSLIVSVGVLNVAFLSLMNAAVYRYSVDFQPFLALAGCLGILAIAERSGRSFLGGIGAAVAAALVLFSLASSLCQAFALYDLTLSENPLVFARVGRIFNAPRLLYENWRQIPLREFKVRAVLPSHALGSVNPLLVTGQESLQDFIYLYYNGPGQLQVGFESIGRGGPVSDPIPVDYGKPVLIELALGSEWPPDGARAYRGMPAAAIATIRRRLMVHVNGAAALDTWVDYHPNKGLFFWGSSPNDPAFGSAFAGGPIRSSSAPLPDPEDVLFENPRAYGPIGFDFVPTGSHLVGVRQPLVCIGYRHRWQCLSMAVGGDGIGHFFLGASANKEELVSRGVDLSGSKRHSLVLSVGGLFPPVGNQAWGATPEAERLALRNKVLLEVDGHAVLEGKLSGSPEVGPSAVVVGRNTLGISDLAVDFTGQIRALGRGGLGAGQSSR